MKKRLLFFAAVITFVFSASFGQTVQDILSTKSYSASFNQVKSDEMKLTFTLDDYKLNVVERDGQKFTEISFTHGAFTELKGFAELPVINANVLLNADYDVTLSIQGEDFIEIQLDYPMIPSRGVIYRNQDPGSIPFIISPESVVDAFYPSEIAYNTDPFVLRDTRGVNVYAHPFRYNAAKNVLRVYKSITVSLVKDYNKSTNPLTITPGYVDPMMNGIYESMFINYDKTRYANELGQFGEILVIYTARDVDVIQPYITWKREVGYIVHTQQVANGLNVKNTIQTAYNNNPNILYVQLVGGWDNIKCDTENLSGNTTAPKDPMLGCVVGTDLYPDIIIGRFVARASANVTTQINKAINYEKTPDLGTWYKNAMGMARNEGAGGGHHGGEADYVHMDRIRDKLLTYNYTVVHKDYDGGVPGVTNTTSTQVSNRINAGISVLNYCNHGYETGWSVASYSNSHVNALTNGNKLPYVWSVACLVGKFNHTSECFAEAWLNRVGGGAVAFLGSTINQPWQPPMTGQDYFNDLLIGGYNYTSNPGGDGNSTNTTAANKRTTFGALSFNGMILMLSDYYSTESFQETIKTWTLFGDASLLVRTDTPQNMTISHNPVVMFGTDFFDVACNVAGARGTITKDGVRIGTAICAGGNISIPISSGLNVGDKVKLVVTAYNKVPYIVELDVTSAGPYANFNATPTEILKNQTVTFTDASGGGTFTSWSWNFGAGATPATATGQGPHVVTYTTPGQKTVSLLVNGTYERIKENYITVYDIFTLTVNTSGSGSVLVNGTPYTGVMNLAENSTAVLQAVPSAGWNFTNWSGGLTGTTNPANLLMNGNKTVTANFMDCNVSSLPFTENFNASTSLPNCWQIVDNQGNGQVWQFGTHTNGLTGSTGNYAYLNSDGFGSGNTQNADLITPTLNLSGYNNVRLTFKHYFRSYTGSSATLSYSVNGGSTWTQIQQWTANTANPATFDQVITAVAGQSNVKFRFKYQGTWGYYWDIDDISITGEEVGGVLNPSAVSASSISDSQINLSWTKNAANNNVMVAFNTTNTFGNPAGAYSVGQAIAGGGTIIYRAGGTTHSHTGLNPNSTYYYKVWSYDGANTYSTGVTTNASTQCGIISTFPYQENFSGGTSACWSLQSNSTTTWAPITTFTVGTTPINPVSGSHFYRCHWVASSQNEWLITPVFNFAGKTPEMKFHFNGSYHWSVVQPNCELSLHVRLNGGAWTQIWKMTDHPQFTSTDVNWIWLETTLNLSAYAGQSNVQFAFRYLGNDGAAFSVDNFIINHTGGVLGDVNNDGVVNVGDVVWMVSHLNGSTPGGFIIDNADVNGDGSVNIADLTALVNVILGVAKDEKSDVNSEIADLYIDENGIVSFSSDGTIAALQFEIESSEANKAEFTTLIDNFTIAFNVIDNKIRGVIYNLDLTPFSEGLVNLFKVSIVEVKNMNWSFALASNVNHELVDVTTHDLNSPLTDDLFAILNNTAKLFPNPNAGNFNIDLFLNTGCYVNIRMFDDKGRLVFSQINSEYAKGINSINFSELSFLKSGIYFVQINAIDKLSLKSILKHDEKVVIVK
ncbi:MAG: choice-of-anchor J domain-containing protein [Bacteroidetes bacterium]|nr:choice-of-anchor J domain-containing protein [Bacteroidota bacterium]